MLRMQSCSYVDPPKNTSVSLMTPNTAIVKGLDFELDCTSEAYPTPTFVWIHNGINNLTEISQRQDSRIEVNTKTGHLVVRGAAYEDAGTYVCIVSNKAGVDSAAINVSIEGKSSVLNEECLWIEYNI